MTCDKPPLETQPPCSSFQKLLIALLLTTDCLRLLAVSASAINILASPRHVSEDLEPTIVALLESDLLPLLSLKMLPLLLTRAILLTCLMK